MNLNKPGSGVGGESCNVPADAAPTTAQQEFLEVVVIRREGLETEAKKGHQSYDVRISRALNKQKRQQFLISICA